VVSEEDDEDEEEAEDESGRMFFADNEDGDETEDDEDDAEDAEDEDNEDDEYATEEDEEERLVCTPSSPTSFALVLVSACLPKRVWARSGCVSHTHFCHNSFDGHMYNVPSAGSPTWALNEDIYARKVTCSLHSCMCMAGEFVGNAGAEID
jgi:hypothetical protein